MLYTLSLGLRAVIFYTVSWILTIWYGLTTWMLAPLPLWFRMGYLVKWNRAVVFLAKWICGVNYQVQGEENITAIKAPFVVMSKHQSQWETYFLQCLFFPTCIVLKKELTQIPFFGWALRQYDPIAIDRSKPKAALKYVQEKGEEKINSGMSMLIFPEGTRVLPGTVGKYARSGASIAVATGAPIIPVAHNAGVYWPETTKLKYPGTVDVIIGKPIETVGKTSKQVIDEVQSWIEGQQEKLVSKHPKT